ncbi:MAG: DUF3945 domain-containing protein [Tannerellaceae bacterium]|jgi:hypothetical protein|nr:DUF3945 domain-containing protein [Tannerellaceae bacterium]
MEGISFRYDNISFKGSQIDRKYSFGNLKKTIENNLEEMKRRGREEYLRELAQEQARQETEKAKQEVKQQAPLSQPQAQNTPNILAIGGVTLTPQQWQTLQEGGYVYLENMTSKDSKTQFSSYVFLNDEKNKAFASKENPETFVKYGQHEMRIRDKKLIEAGYMTKATVKWWGGGYAHPYLWKENKVDAEYRESWSDPRLSKAQKEEQKVKPLVAQKKNRGRRM